MNRISERLLGRYELLDQLGITGLASVYRARDTRDDAVVALKVLHAYFSQEADLLHSYLQEMARVQELRHPNIIPVHGVERDDETTAVVMDYVPWPNLKARRSRVLPLGEVLTILRQVASALDYAHSQGIVHRHLRPSNVLYNQETGQAMVSDFGTVILLEGGHLLIRSTVHTTTSSYAPPEQIQGQPPSPSNDVYALGALAYELLTGNIPFDALNPYTVLRRQVTTTPTPPSHLDETLPAAVDDVVLKALRRRPEERYTSCTEMVDALEQAAESYTVVKPTATRPSERQAPLVEAEGRVICPYCGMGNPATAPYCHACWGTLVERPVITREEELRRVRRYLAALRRRKRLIRSVVGGLLAGVLAFWVFNLFEIRPPLPAPSSTISSQSAAGDWATVQRDPLHTGASPGPTFTPKGTVKWQFKSEGPVLAAPAVAGGRVYVGTSDYRVVALDKATGAVLWTHPVSGPVDSSPTVADDLVFVGLRDSTILAMDANSGDLRWSYETNGAIYGSATVMNGSLYIGSSDRRLYSLDARTGEERWPRETTARIISSPATNRGIVVTSTQDGELYMVDTSNGTVRNQVMVSPTSISVATLVDDVAYFATRSGKVVAFKYTQKDISFQKAIWNFWLHFYVWGMSPRPPLSPGFLWGIRLGEGVMGDLATADGRLFVATVGGKLHALELETGKRLWEVEGLGHLYTSPIVSGDTVIQAAFDGTIYGIDMATGEERWSVSVDEKIITSIVVAGDTLYVPTITGTVYALQ